MNKLKVLCCSGSLDGGGSERQLLQFASLLPVERYSASIFLQHLRGVLLTEVPDRIPVYSLDGAIAGDGPQEAAKSLAQRNQPASSLLARIPGQLHRDQVKYLRKLVVDSKTQLIYDRTFHATLLTSAACKKTPTARISVIVSPPSRDLGQSNERFLWLKRRLLRTAYRDPAAIALAVSHDTAKDAERFYGLDAGSIEVLPSPVDCYRIRQLAEVALAETAHASPASSRRIVCVGRFTREKGQADLVRAIAELNATSPPNNWQLTLLGDGPELQELQSLVQELGLSRQVVFAGFLSNPHPIIKQADCLCIPSRYEGLPNVALEAMALETPVVATRSSESLVQLLGADNQRGYLVEADQTPLKIADAINQRFSDPPALVTRRILAAREWVESHHGIAPWLLRMEELLEEAIRRKEKSWQK